MAVTEYKSIHGQRLGLGSTRQLVIDGQEVEFVENVTIALAASSTTDGMDITVTVVDGYGNTVTGVRELEIYMSEAATGIGITGDTYSGDLTATTGAIISALTAKKHWKVVTAATGIFEATLVASANPADQYVVCKRPITSTLVVSAASGTNWEGA